MRGGFGQFGWTPVGGLAKIGLVGEDVCEGDQLAELWIGLGLFGGVMETYRFDDAGGQVPLLGEEGANFAVIDFKDFLFGFDDGALAFVGEMGGFPEFAGENHVEDDLADVVEQAGLEAAFDV